MVYAIENGMAATVLSIDRAGRVVLPKPIRDRLRLRPGSRLEVEVHDDHLRLIPLARGPALVEERGWWVHQGTPDPGADLAEAVERHRRERIEDLGR
jgi:AbrB family looped-hinge helix DNA binding protein